MFSTSMVGYPETLTDPSYRGQIVCLTYPLVGNYGVPSYEIRADHMPVYFESEGVQPRGLVVHETCETPNHRQSVRTLDKWLLDEDVPGIYGIDTRRLARVLRERGVMLSCIAIGEEAISLEPSNLQNPNDSDLVGEVSIKEPLIYREERRKKVVLIDCGTKLSIIRNLLKRDVAVVRVPHNSSFDLILGYDPLGVVVSNGPGDPQRCDQTINTIRELMNSNIPILGICLGTQLIALAAGADTYKMKYGHRSQNQPVLNLETKRCYITAQNHGYAVDRSSLEGAGLNVWFVNANDQSIEGLRHPEKLCLGVQWHPEASPGPMDTEFIFDLFLQEAANHAST